MLNPDLHLNKHLFDDDVEKLATRDGYGTGIVELGEKDENVVVLSADLTESTRANVFAEKFPERFFNVGVAEQNMAAVAAGLGVSGKTAFLSSYATFSPGKNWETIRTTAVYNNANVKVAGHHAGVMTGPDGATHQATEDIAITRCWPGIDIFVPCDAIEAKKATIAAGKKYGPVYLRYSRDKTPSITTAKTPFDRGKIETFWVTEKPQAVIFATGYMLYYALVAAKELQKDDIHVLVANVATIKPLDEHAIIDLVKKTGAAVTVEDHQVMGGLGGAIAETTAKHLPTPIEFVGLRDTFAESGTPEELIKKYKMDTPAIKKAVHTVIGRK
ncbi:MAG TPA: transketolase C-terminal domain-containing protein [Candidatus Levybacteria bacterium]|nr:transketolase C-terminal domain-containing protein [Candidatus Levybacteria bacterium]